MPFFGFELTKGQIDTVYRLGVAAAESGACAEILVNKKFIDDFITPSILSDVYLSPDDKSAIRRYANRQSGKLGELYYRCSRAAPAPVTPPVTSPVVPEWLTLGVEASVSGGSQCSGLSGTFGPPVSGCASPSSTSVNLLAEINMAKMLGLPLPAGVGYFEGFVFGVRARHYIDTRGNVVGFSLHPTVPDPDTTQKVTPKRLTTLHFGPQFAFPTGNTTVPKVVFTPLYIIGRQTVDFVNQTDESCCGSINNIFSSGPSRSARGGGFNVDLFLNPQGSPTGMQFGARFGMSFLRFGEINSPNNNSPFFTYNANAGSQTETSVNFGLFIQSDRRLKRDIVALGTRDDGLGLYRYRYLWSDVEYVGVMAQEVALVRPDAVVRGADGYLRVNYAQLGLAFQTWSEWAALPAR
ncbi:MAG: tail fiber domain-containing protein [Deltaproteobacteria bacterium]|nr:tail fiber domain-containing protein [Deltaproteobacteria bacterium]